MPSRRTAAGRLPLQIRLLGGLDLDWRGGAAVGLSAKKSRALLAYLALKPGRPESRDSLASLLWGDMGDEQARANLRVALFSIRRALGAAGERVVRADDDSVVLDDATFECDALVFEQGLAAGTMEALRKATELYRGDLLHGFVSREAAFEEWVAAQRERLHAGALAALRRLLDSDEAAGDSETAVQTAHRLLALDPLQESAHRALMRIYARQGQRGAAVRQYTLCTDTLRRELGVRPDPETTRVYAEVVDAAAVAPPVLAPARAVRRRAPRTTVPLGSHGLPLVGREHEMAVLRRELDAKWAGGGRRLTLVLGEAGVGKTRLVDELAAVVGQRHGRVLVGQAHQTDQMLSFGVWSELLRGVSPEDVADAKLEPIARMALTSIAPALCPDVVPSVGADALRLFDAVTRLVTELARQQPLLLVFDDLHWADDMSLRLLAHAARRLEGERLMLVGTAREEEWEGVPVLRQVVEDLTRADAVSSLTLGPLSRDAAERMLRLLTPRLPEPEAASPDAVWRVSEGNPLVIVEIVAALADGALEGTTTLLPRRVRELIAHRLAQLPAPSRQILSLAAVIGRQFDARLLRHATGLDEATVAEHLEELTRRRVLRDTGAGVGFSHVRVQEVAYALTAPTRRRALHGVVARAIEAADPSAVAEQAHVLARHWREAGDLDRAATRLLTAGRRAIMQPSARHAMEHYEEGLALLATLPDTDERLALGLALRLHCANARIPLGHAQVVARYAVEAEALARRLGDEARLGVAQSLASRSALMSGDATEMRRRAEEALAIGRRLGEAELTGDASYLASFASFMLGDYRYAVALSRDAIDRGLDVSRPDATFTAPRPPLFRAVLAQSLGELGEAADAEAIADDALAWATERQYHYAMIVASYARGHVAWLRDDTPGAIAAFTLGADIASAAGYIQLMPLMRAGLGIARAREGQAESAVDTIRAALAQAEQAGLTMLVTHQSLWLAEASLLAGRPEEARAHAERTEAMARGRREAGFEAWALWVRAAALARAGDSAAAEATSRAEALAERLGMRPLLARCRARPGS